MKKIDEYFYNRRSVREFEKREVERDLIDALLEASANAPTTGNMQLYCAVVSDGEDKKRLNGAHFNQPAAVNAPMLVTFCADFNLFYRWCELNKAKAGYANLQGLLMGVFDAVIFAQQFVTLAEMNGLGTCYLGTTTYNVREIAEELNLPDMVVPLLTVAVGYPSVVPEAPGRLGKEAYVHHGKYKQRSDEEVKALFAEKEQREDSKGYVAENGKETLAQVFTEVRYPQSMLEEFSGVLRGYLAERFGEI